MSLMGVEIVDHRFALDAADQEALLSGPGTEGFDPSHPLLSFSTQGVGGLKSHHPEQSIVSGAV